ncbi:MAG TPA: thiamine phosphate synthase [Candidatus Binatia bacterium]|jgi:thiamine-phosphate diphosphorylase
MRALPNPPVQLITGAWHDLPDLRRRIEAALRGGIRWIQLRAKTRSARELHEAAVAVEPLLRPCGALLVICDRVDVALSIGAGVHLPENGMSAGHARELLGRDAWIGRSVHSVAAIRTVAPGELDALQFGPVFDTASKREFGPPQGLAELAHAATAVREGCRATLIAVGGITFARVPACRRAGADAVAMIGAAWDAGDIEAAARRLVRA